MSFSVMFWNIENFGRSINNDLYENRVDKVYNHIKKKDPDVVGFCEIWDKVALRSLLTEKLTEYDFAVTDGKEGIELLSGWKRNKFEQVIFTQRREFKAESEYLRPGSLVSLKHNGKVYNILFLHTDSGTKNKDYSNRQTMFEKIWSLKDTFDSIKLFNPTHFITTGDLNTMGRKRSGEFSDISAEKEITDLQRDANDNQMRLLKKDHDLTFNNGQLTSNLDHVIATNNIGFDKIDDCEVIVNGWTDLYGSEQEDFINNISDHCSLYFKVV